jgi:hypothetical protein
VQGVRPAVGDEAVLDPAVIQARVAQPADPRRDYEAARVEKVLAVRDQQFMIADSERTEPATVGRVEGRGAALGR